MVFHLSECFLENSEKLGHLGGSAGWASDFDSGRDLTVREFKPRIGLTAVSAELAHFGSSVPFSLCLSPACALSQK